MKEQKQTEYENIAMDMEEEIYELFNLMRPQLNDRFQVLKTLS